MQYIVSAGRALSSLFLPRSGEEREEERNLDRMTGFAGSDQGPTFSYPDHPVILSTFRVFSAFALFVSSRLFPVPVPHYNEWMAKDFSHMDAQGRARMVDVGGKPLMRRTAVASGQFVAAPGTLDRLTGAGGAEPLPKGEALAVARIAGISAAKKTGDLIPLCHPLPLDHVRIDFERAAEDRLLVTASASITAKTGIEMEALTAGSIACLTLYDMAKAVDKNLRIENIRLIEKRKEPVD